jgi:glyoxylase-like metal-dependent hydrolase (beta-lactamase superfamily II)
VAEPFSARPAGPPEAAQLSVAKSVAAGLEYKSMATPAEKIAAHTTLLDLEYLGYPRIIAACVCEGPTSIAVIDPGPERSLGTLRAKLADLAIGIKDLDAILLTHIHLDHAGATGTIVKENPKIQVYVHERGAVHMADPAKLLTSAQRLYGDKMDYLWGEFLAVPRENIHALAGGERLEIGGRKLEVVYTPGHASHHVSYFDQATGLAFVGDTAGIRIANSHVILPVTPPPDIDLEAWRKSWQEIRARKPERLFLTHFGPATRVEHHLGELEARLEEWGALVQESLANGRTDTENADLFERQIEAKIREKASETETKEYVIGGALGLCWQGLARYWRKRAGAK